MQASLEAAARLVAAGQYGPAADLCRSLLTDGGAAQPALLNLLGEIALGQKQPDAAAEWLRASLRTDPAQPVAWLRLGVALHASGQSDEALVCLDQAVRRGPRLAQAHVERGILLRDLGRFDDALECYGRALAARPDFAPAHFAQGLLLQQMRRFEPAMAAFEAATALRPDYAEAHVAKAELLLLLGRYREGWALYAWRLRTRLGRTHRLAGPEIPAWTGAEPLAGRTVLLLPEFGLGDCIMMFRYARLLRERGAAVVASTPAPLRALFSQSDGVRVAASGEPLPPIDFQCPIMSLPSAFDTRSDSVPAPIPYLASTPAKRSLWRQRLGEARRPRVGLMWSGRQDRNIDRNPLRDRRVPLALLAPLAALPVEFHALQKDLPEADEALLARLGFISDHRRHIADFADTAALIDLMDLVISVDTSVAHLAGALGRPLWVMLPFATDYRWGPEGDYTPWYPAANLFRQPRPGDWRAVIGAVDRRLAQFAGMATGPGTTPAS